MSEEPNKAKGTTTGVTKTLSALLALKTNKTCAECRSALVDPLLVHASLCPSQEDIRRNPQIMILNSSTTHQAFAPPSMQSKTTTTDHNKYPSDPAVFVNQKFGGHGVFLCANCAEAHKSLDSTVAIVLPVLGENNTNEHDVWTPARAEFMKDCGGNARSWAVYEAYMPEKWKQRRPKASSSIEERRLFVKAKYEALAFTLPPPGRDAEEAWISILNRKKNAERFISTDLKNIYCLTPSHEHQSTRNNNTNNADGGTMTTSSLLPAANGELPNRLIDFFCVVTCSMQLHPNEIKKDLSNLTSPEELVFWPQVGECYPDKDAHSQDTQFPEHLPSFVLPEGCRPSTSHKTPAFFTFVLTTGDGDRLYGGALQIYDDTKGIDELREALLKSGYEGILPTFLEESEENDEEIVFFSKSLVLLSHHPFFDLFRTSLKLLNSLTLVESPLPIERYIANLCREVPLPPQGRIKVEFNLTPNKTISVERPPCNHLPMANFSYRPLFATLSVGNIMVVLGYLMEECKVVLLSQHYSILCPVAEALLSALFPFEWQGLYIPIMPFAMLDILDAPVPFLAGMSSRYLTEIDPKMRPRDLVFVDLDRDIVQVGIDETTGDKRKIPGLPAKAAWKLKSALEQHGSSSAYMLPTSGIKGCIMSGIIEPLLIKNEERPVYAQMENVQIFDEESLNRKDVFEMSDKAYEDGEDNTEIQTQGYMKSDSEDEGVSEKEQPRNHHVGRFKKFQKMKNKKKMFVSPQQKKKVLLSNSNRAGSQGHLLDIDEPKPFNSAEIRNAFLRFLISIFMDYQDYLIESGGDLFDNEAFINKLYVEKYAREWVSRVCQTQMFQRFLEERNEHPEDPEIRFFDESIIAKLNRSKKEAIAKGGKKIPTPFLDDDSERITKTFTPPQPSILGLPDHESTYQYGTFPDLDQSLFGSIRPPSSFDVGLWPKNHSMRWKKPKLTKAQQTQRDLFKKSVMKPDVTPNLKRSVSDIVKRSVRDLETALTYFIAPKNGKVHGKSRGKEKKGRNKESMKHSESTASQESDLTESSDHFDFSQRYDDLSRADTIIINARRKQAILLDVIVKVQATYRMYRIRQQYFGGEKPRKEKRQFRSACRLQQHFRGYAARHQYRRMRSCTILIQKCIRARRNLLIFDMIRDLISKVQARIRGILVRKRLGLLFSEKMKVYRAQIFSLWKAAFVPLSLRTKLWPTIAAKEGFSRMRLCESEISRLIKIIGIDMNMPGSSMNDSTIQLKASSRDIEMKILDSFINDSTIQLSESLGIDNQIYCICKRLATELPEHVKGKTPISLETAEGIEQAERLQIYERLGDKSFDKNQAADLYESFLVPKKEKHKKVFLAQSIWNNYGDVKKSISTMLIFFPELDSSLNIVFREPSSKSRRRFSKADKVVQLPVDKNFWDEISLEGKLKKHMKEVATIYMTKVPTIMAVLDLSDRKKNAKMENYRQALTKAYNMESWEQCRHKMIVDYLVGPKESIVNPPRCQKVANPFADDSPDDTQVNPPRYQKVTNPFADDSPDDSQVNPPRYQKFTNPFADDSPDDTQMNPPGYQKIANPFAEDSPDDTQVNPPGYQKVTNLFAEDSPDDTQVAQYLEEFAKVAKNRGEENNPFANSRS
eukprot:CAMPEP_0194204628 /NCGR_PEP_ID=MMETSP0156-20130528/4096_1 /TAXON_ID=33649 /ORGANISM="Thalassionema nitzschioides, Strain L26-B" /LENGTH=1620 /DNA_ID=CAMNT_0038930687 /DNA_START=42 /DNA_END=4904 /DNA_ORIENTATION=-